MTATAIGDFDLARIDRAFIDNPFPTLRALREKHPVHRMADGSVLLTRHADCQKVYQSRAMLSDKRAEFGRKFGAGPLFTHHSTSLVFNDPPYHTVVRKLLAGAFTPRKLAEMEPLIEGIVERMLDELEDMGRFDLIAAFAMVLPTEIISFMLGIPESYRRKLRGYSLAILGALDPVVPPERLAAGHAAVTEFGAILADLIAHRRAHPEGAAQGEVLENLIFGEVDGRHLTEEELVQNCIFLLNAGHETTTSLVGNTIAMLLAHPDHARHVLQDRHALYDKNTLDWKMLRPVLGQTLLTTDGELITLDKSQAIRQAQETPPVSSPQRPGRGPASCPGIATSSPAVCHRQALPSPAR